MNKSILLIVIAFVCYSPSFSQSSANTLDVCHWNIEWFGATDGNGPSNKDLQEQNVVKVLRYIKADIFGMCEVVDTMRFRRVVDSLNIGATQYAFKVADWGTLATTPSASAWLADQKTAFIYDKNLFTNVTFRAFMASSSNAYNNWGTGRLPQLMNANVTINGITKNINFFLVHAKSGSDATSYTRRQAGFMEMRDSMDLEYPNAINLIIGDYNDILNGTICTTCGGISSVDYIVRDSAVYKSLTLPLQNAGKTSEIGYTSVIDNHIISIKGYPYYIANSVLIRTDATATVASYSSNNTSDHYPVFTQYNLGATVTAVNTVTAEDFGIKTSPNPFTNKIVITFSKAMQDVQMNLVDVAGRVVIAQNKKTVYQGETVELPIGNISQGIYLLQVKTAQIGAVVKLVR